MNKDQMGLFTISYFMQVRENQCMKMAADGDLYLSILYSKESISFKFKIFNDWWNNSSEMGKNEILLDCDYLMNERSCYNLLRKFSFLLCKNCHNFFKLTSLVFIRIGK